MYEKKQAISLNKFVFNATISNSIIFLWGFTSFLTIFYIRDFIYFSNSTILILAQKLIVVLATYIMPTIITFSIIYYTYFKGICINIYKVKDLSNELSTKEKNRLLLSFQSFKTWLAWLFIVFSFVLFCFILNYYVSTKITSSFIDTSFYIWLFVCLTTMCYISIIKTEFYIMQVRCFLKIHTPNSKLFNNKNLYYSGCSIFIIILGLITIFFNNEIINETKSIYNSNLIKTTSYKSDYKGYTKNHIDTLSNITKHKIYRLYIPSNEIKSNILIDSEHENLKSSIIFLLISINTIMLFIYTRKHIDLYSKFQQEAITKTLKNVIDNGFSTSQKINISTFGYLARISILINNLFDRIRINSNLVDQNIKSINNIENHNLEIIDRFKQYVNKTLKNSSEINSYLNQQTKKIKDQAVVINHNNLSIDLVSSKISEQKNFLTNIDNFIITLSEQLFFIKKTVDKKNDLQETFNTTINKSIATIDFNSNIYQNIKKSLSTISDSNQKLAKVANQLDLLSMNASIEASHIGKLGEGFSAIASEIKQLGEACNSQCKILHYELNEILQKIYKTEINNNRYYEYFQDIHDNFFNENNFFDDINQINNFYEKHTKDISSLNQLFHTNNEKISEELKAYITNKKNLTTQVDNIGELNRNINIHIKGLLEISENEYIDLNTIFENINKKKENLATLNNIFDKFTVG